MRPFAVSAIFCALFGSIIVSPASAVTVYNDHNTFVSAAGPGLQFEGFDDIPTDSVGQAAFSDGAVFGDGAFTLDALSLSSDAVLSGMGLTGTFLVRTSTDPNINLWPGPGGIAGTSSPRDDDDFRITFNHPMRAFGILIVENHRENGEYLKLFAEDGREIVSVGLPGSKSGIGRNGFRGFIATSPLDYIKSVEVNEGQNINDDIGFDWVYFDPVPEPGSLALLGLTGVFAHTRRRPTC